MFSVKMQEELRGMAGIYGSLRKGNALTLEFHARKVPEYPTSMIR